LGNGWSFSKGRSETYTEAGDQPASRRAALSHGAMCCATASTTYTSEQVDEPEVALADALLKRS